MGDLRGWHLVVVMEGVKCCLDWGLEEEGLEVVEERVLGEVVGLHPKEEQEVNYPV